MDQTRRGYLYGAAAYTMWGFFPLYFKLLRPSGAVEILAHRVVWSVLFVALLLAVKRNWAVLTGLVRQPKALFSAISCGVLIGLNWGIYIYGVNTERVVETALGYFINPLMMVVFGVLLLKERLRIAQFIALGIGATAVGVLSVDYGRLPYLALGLAVTFGLYGLTKKRVGLPAAEGLFVESAVLALPAVGYLTWQAWQGSATFGSISPTHTLLIAISGVATAVPLLLFASAANRIPLSTLGILQYIAPILQLVCGVLILHEPMPPARLAGFSLVWCALVIFTVDGLRNARRQSRAAQPTTPGPKKPASAADKQSASAKRQSASARKTTAGAAKQKPAAVAKPARNAGRQRPTATDKWSTAPTVEWPVANAKRPAAPVRSTAVNRPVALERPVTVDRPAALERPAAAVERPVTLERPASAGATQATAKQATTEQAVAAAHGTS